jgi:hypothetical protein
VKPADLLPRPRPGNGSFCSAPAQPLPPPAPGAGDRVEPMSVMRKKIADHDDVQADLGARRTVYEIDMTNVKSSYAIATRPRSPNRWAQADLHAVHLSGQ